MDAQTHKLAVIVGAISVSLSYLVMVATLAYLAATHDGVYADRLVQALLGSGLILAVLILGAPVVAQIASALGFRVPVASPPTRPAPPNEPSQEPGGPAGA